MSAAARALVHEARVDGLLRSARSTTSVSDSRTAPAAAESCFSAAVAAGDSGGIGEGGGVRAAGGTGQGVDGDGGAPGTPSIRGVPGAHALIRIVAHTVMTQAPDVVVRSAITERTQCRTG